MYAVAFDLTIAEVEAVHPKGYQAAYEEIARALRAAGFRRVQGSVYVTERPDLAAVTQGMVALKALPWFGRCVRDIRAFKVEDWSDFTPFMKGN